jgi:hypothetical protein
MLQKEGYSVMQQHADHDYGRYEGNETSSTRQYNQTPYEQDMKEGLSGKVYPLPSDRMKFFRLALPVISLVLLVLFALLFVVVIGGTTGWVSFVAVCFVLCCILAYTWTITQPME